MAWLPERGMHTNDASQPLLSWDSAGRALEGTVYRRFFKISDKIFNFNGRGIDGKASGYQSSFARVYHESKECILFTSLSAGGTLEEMSKLFPRNREIINFKIVKISTSRIERSMERRAQYNLPFLEIIIRLVNASPSSLHWKSGCWSLESTSTFLRDYEYIKLQ